MTRSLKSLAGLVVLTALHVLPLSAQANEEELRAFFKSYAEAFNNKDAAAVGSMWTEDATHLDRETGERTTGRAAIQADVEEAFKTQPKASLAGQPQHVQVITPDVIRIEGQSSIAAPGETPSVSQFTAIVVKQDGKWQIASIEEAPVTAPSDAASALSELDWLVGSWVDDSEEMRVDTKVRWAPNQAFLIRSFVVQMGDEVARQGTQVIGWDPRSREIRSWSFDSDGSFGDGVWSKSGEDWLVKSSQTLADGRAASGTYVMTKVDDNTITMQLIGHEVEGQPQPMTEAVTVVRVAADEATAAQPSNTP